MSGGFPKTLAKVAEKAERDMVDRLANSALRVQASCMAMGQAAGALAAQSSVDGGVPRDVDLASVRALLRKHGAVVPWGLDARPAVTG